MNDSCFFRILELHSSNTPFSISVKKGDTGRKLVFKFADNSNPYTITDDCYAIFTARKNDGNIIYNQCEIADNAVIYAFTAQTCAASGSVPCEIRLYGADGKLITSPRFLLEVEDTVYSDGDVIESLSEATALSKLLDQVKAFEDDIQQKLAENAFADAHSAVCFTHQDLTDSQKYQARTNISAAVAGFGLGGSAELMIVSAEGLDTATRNGWYRFQGSATTLNNVTFQSAAVFVSNFDTEGYVVQQLWPVNTGTRLYRYRNANTAIWSVWECDAPPMLANVEYRTTERHYGKPVYAKLVRHTMTKDTGTATSVSNFSINGNVANVDSIVDVTAVYAPSNGNKSPLPVTAADGHTYLSINTIGMGTLYTIVIINNAVIKQGETIDIIYKYTKTTDSE